MRKSVKDELLQLLEDNSGTFISGNEFARLLCVTRAAVWKHIQELEDEGYKIEVSRSRGYRLSEKNDMITEHSLRELVGDDDFTFDVYSEVDSTNKVIRDNVKRLPTWRVVAAGSQRAGRGRLGRSFFSPPDSGLYISVLLRPKMPIGEAYMVTTTAAVAVAQAVEDCGGESPEIKWVNDVYLNGRKICGILTEASVSVESGDIDYAILGVGINVYEPDDGFPEDIRDIAGAAFSEHQGGLRAKLAASFLKRFKALFEDFDKPTLVKEYRRRSFIAGCNVNVIREDEIRPAYAEAIDDNCGLIVKYEDGTRETLMCGEVSVRKAV